MIKAQDTSNSLIVYPTSRALRSIRESFKETDRLLPTFMRMDEFESRSISVGAKNQVDAMERILLLRDAASFEAFNKLKLNPDLVRFFTRSDAIFKFFEELANEKVEFYQLECADAYSEFDEHIRILKTLKERYKSLLDERGCVDKAFLPEIYTLNEGFIKRYNIIEVHLEGYLSRFELELLDKISCKTTLILHYTTSKFTTKMQERFKEYGLELLSDHDIFIDFSSKQIISSLPINSNINAKVVSTQERYEQIPLAFGAIQDMVNDGIDPKNIVLILPDESFKHSFVLYDRYNNLNFAMGHDYSMGQIYKSLEAIKLYWQSFDSKDRHRLIRYDIKFEILDSVDISKKITIEVFFRFLNDLGLLDCPLEGEILPYHNDKVYEKYLLLRRIFVSHQLSYADWLSIWLKAIGEITIDDIRGGKVTVMGALETRGVVFDGVVIVDFNEGVTPALPGKDQFLNSSVRVGASLPTKSDREALQKQIYKRVLEQAKRSVIIYSISNNKLPSRFIYELGLQNSIKEQTVDYSLFYDESSQFRDDKDIVVAFDATKIIWSSSMLGTYLTCKRKYYYKYIKHIKAKPEEELNEGNMMHTLLQKVYEKYNFFDHADTLTKKINMQINELVPQDDAKNRYKKLLWQEKLRGFVDAQISHFKAGWRVVERELEICGEINGLKFRGRCDRIDQDSTHTFVLDYKTGKTSEANKEKNLEDFSDFQMSIYHQLLLKKYKNIKLAFVKIFDRGKIEEARALEEKDELLFANIAQMKSTKTLVASKCENLKICEYCEFALVCQRGEYL
ncbi:MAG: PD-(D/E)XK nuclease family protein [Campylobacterales bacterium]|nr:PD-(D/E)XK nuclease family protein [Campylobacterales bacterium]